MKKLIVAAALAVASIAVSAQQVEVYGKMRIYQERDSVGGAQGVNRQSNDLSRWGIRASENLGSGLKAFANIETGIAADQPAAATVGDYTSLVGLDTDQWRVALGRDMHQIARTFVRFDPLGNAYGSTTGTIHNRHNMRLNNTAFLSVTPVKGLTAHYQRAASEANGVPSTQVYGLDATFGPISAAAVRLDNGLDGANKAASTLVAGRINLGTAGTSVIGMWSEDDAGLVRTQGKTVGVTQRLGGPLSVMATYGTKQGTDAVAAGATYDLSKRTFLHARYREERATVNSLDRRQFGVGFEHNF